MGPVKQFFEAISSLTDIFNLGRLVFYTAAGALLVYPAAAGLQVLAQPTLSGHAFCELAAAFRVLVTSPDTGLIVVSIVAGFVIAGFGFTRVLGSISPSAKASAESSPIDRRSYPFRYPQLKNMDGHDYDAWLIQEYFRFVEIVTYVPLGFLGGLASVTLYAAAYVVSWSAAGHGAAFAAPHATLVVSAAVFAVVALLVWPRFWVPRVVEPVLEAYHRAKLGVVAALDERKPTPRPAAGKI